MIVSLYHIALGVRKIQGLCIVNVANTGLHFLHNLPIAEPDRVNGCSLVSSVVLALGAENRMVDSESWLPRYGLGCQANE